MLARCELDFTSVDRVLLMGIPEFLWCLPPAHTPIAGHPSRNYQRTQELGPSEFRACVLSQVASWDCT